ncbi:iron-sulfur cluster assembly scaffold protein [Candidatus Babeliales bacterium]|nr:iron-sulfur cluster assembly scaffold protein [Candidatus Babeliales bacterium]
MNNHSFYLIQQDLQFHAKNPSNFGLVPDLDFVSGQQNPSCGDSVMIGGKVHDGKITALCFQGSGCVISMAMASKLTVALVGKSLIEIEQLNEEVIEPILGLSLGLNRMKCGLLSIMALQKGIASFKQGQKV